MAHRDELERCSIHYSLCRSHSQVEHSLNLNDNKKVVFSETKISATEDMIGIFSLMKSKRAIQAEWFLLNVRHKAPVGCFEIISVSLFLQKIGTYNLRVNQWQQIFHWFCLSVCLYWDTNRQLIHSDVKTSPLQCLCLFFPTASLPACFLVNRMIVCLSFSSNSTSDVSLKPMV